MVARNGSKGSRILIVEDDDNVRRLVSAYLEQEGFRVFQAVDGESATRLAEELMPDLVILDLMLPGVDGLEVAARIREKAMTPILMLTSRVEEADMLDGFQAGADDYLTKPFSPKVLVARVRAVLARSLAGNTDEEQSRLLFGGLSLDLKSHEVRVDGRSIELTMTEFQILRVLLEHPGWVYTREELFLEVSGYTQMGDSRTVDTHIANIRRKIEEDPANPAFIGTVRGVGYKIQKEQQ